MEDKMVFLKVTAIEDNHLLMGTDNNWHEQS